MKEETSLPVSSPDKDVSGPESLMMWLFLAFFVLLAAIIFSDLVAVFVR